MEPMARRRSPTKVPTPLQDIATDNPLALNKIVRHTLPNGLRLWIKPRPGTGTLALLGQVPVGARYENKDNNGISHFLEHMVFTGTRRWNEDEVMEVIRRRGGSVNARTGREDTIFYLHVKADDLPLGLEWLSEVLFRPALADDKFDKERKVIINEKGGQFGWLEDLFEWIEDRGWGWNVFRTVRMHLWGRDNSLHLSVIGKDKSLNAITLDELRRYHQRYYVPNNITLLIVGDCDPQEVIDRATAVFGEIPSGPPPQRPPTPSVRESAAHFRLHGPSFNEQGQWMLAAPLPGLLHPDRHALIVLSEILETVLTRKIRHERGLTYGISVYPALYCDLGYFTIYTSVDDDRFDEVGELVYAEVERARSGGLTATELDEAQHSIRGRTILSMEGNLDHAWWLSEESMFTPDDRPIPDFLEAVAAVTLDDLQRVAQTYLAGDKLIDVHHRPALTPKRAIRPAVALGALALVGGVVGWLWWRNRRDG